MDWSNIDVKTPVLAYIKKNVYNHNVYDHNVAYFCLFQHISSLRDVNTGLMAKSIIRLCRFVMDYLGADG